jgi:hypothetical protein
MQQLTYKTVWLNLSVKQMPSSVHVLCLLAEAFTGCGVIAA